MAGRVMGLSSSSPSRTDGLRLKNVRKNAHIPPIVQCASAIAFLISPMALPGFKCFGHVFEQFMIVWHL